jgi:hypothetical protein
VAHRLLRVIWKVLHAQLEYIEYGPLALNTSARHKRKQQLIRELKKLEYVVQLTPLTQGGVTTP